MQGKHTPWASLFGFLPAAILAAFVTISLHDYTAPIFSVEQEDTAVSTQEITANGKKSSSKTAAVTTKAAPTVEPLAEQNDGYKDGTYTGSAVCETYNYNVTVTIVISGDTITSVTAESEAGAQDVQYFNMANAKVPSQLLANQSTSGVDSVSGATKSSNAIKKAFYYAYKSAKK